MDNMAVAQTFNARQLSAGSGRTGAAAQQPTDAFSALLAQLTGSTEPGEDMQQALLNLTQEQNSEEATELAMNLLAEMLAAGPINLQELLAEAGIELPQGHVEQLAAGNINLAESLSKEQLSMLENYLAEKAQPQQPPQGQTQATGFALPFEVVQQPGEQAEVPQQANFHRNLQATQQLLESQGKQATEEEPIDIEALQSDVENGKYFASSLQNVTTTQHTAEVEKAEQVDPQELLNQVQNGIIKQMDKGKDEFIIKLRPEGLGEITVKMVQNGGKIAMSIITTTAHTERMLNNELNTLRAALRPFNAEVEQVTTAREASSYEGYQQQSHNFAQQQQFWGNGRGQQQFSGNRQQQQHQQDVLAAAEAVTGRPVLAGNTALDTYI